MNRTIVAVLGLLSTLVACGQRLDELEPPSYAWNDNDGTCNSTLAVDGSGMMWLESACENSLTSVSQVGKITDSQLARIAAAFAAHPETTTFGTPGCESDDFNVRHRFSERQFSGAAREWTYCTSWENAGDQPDHPAPFDETVLAFKEARAH